MCQMRALVKVRVTILPRRGMRKCAPPKLGVAPFASHSGCMLCYVCFLLTFRVDIDIKTSAAQTKRCCMRVTCVSLCVPYGTGASSAGGACGVTAGLLAAVSLPAGPRPSYGDPTVTPFTVLLQGLPRLLLNERMTGA